MAFIEICSVCGDVTEFGCVDCGIDTGTMTPVCTRTRCRDEHERRAGCKKCGAHPCRCAVMLAQARFGSMLGQIIGTLCSEIGYDATDELLSQFVAEIKRVATT